MKKEKWALIDLENIGSTLKNISLESYSKVIIFVGKNQNNLSLSSLATDKVIDVNILKIKEISDNNLDFHLSYYLGRFDISEAENVSFVVISNDRGYDNLIKHINSNSRRCNRLGSKKHEIITASNTVQSNINTEKHTKAVDNIVKIMSKIKGDVHLSTLKSKIMTSDSGFNENMIGFDNFSSLIESIDSICLSTNKTTCKYIKNDNIQKISNLNAIYNSLLKKKNWRAITKQQLLQVYSETKKYDKIEKKTLLDNLIISLAATIAATNIRKAISIFIKSNILIGKKFDTQIGETLWGINANITTVYHVLFAQDVALVTRLINACMEDEIPFDKKIVEGLLYSAESKHDVDLIIKLAKEKKQLTC